MTHCGGKDILQDFSPRFNKAASSTNVALCWMKKPFETGFTNNEPWSE